MRKYVVILLATLCCATSARADVYGIRNDAEYQRRTQRSASPMDYAAARSILPRVSAPPPSVWTASAPPSSPSQVVGQDGHPPLVEYKGAAIRLFDPAILPAESHVEARPAPDAVGTGNIHFTSSQVFPAAADTAYPYLATGRLWYTKNGLWTWCSASVLKPGIVLTAGHCVHAGNAAPEGFYANWQFVPAFRNGVAPVGVWTAWVHAGVTGSWYFGGGTVPNDADYAMVVFNTNSSGRRIGDITGWLGWQYPWFVGKHVSVMGYPQNLDNAQINHRVDSPVFQYNNNTGVYGSDMSGGSSGGAVVLNFGVGYVDIPSQWELNRNRLTSVVSYGWDPATGILMQGGSQFDARFAAMLTDLCATFPWAC